MTNTGTSRDRSLLGPGDPAPLDVVNPQGSSPVVLTCEHAGLAIPEKLGDLGIPAAEMQRHIAYDIGAEALARRLSQRLDALLITQPYSRLVVDCNRPLDAPDCLPAVSDGTPIPANARLDQPARQQRFDEIHQPFHREITHQLDARQASGQPTLLIAVHSFTPQLATSDHPRPWYLGLLYHRDDRLARRMMTVIDGRATSFLVAFNQPYHVDDASDYTIPVHGETRDIPHVLLEIRSDQIENTAGQTGWADLLTAMIGDVLEREGEAP